MQFEAMFYVKQRQKVNVYRGFNDLRSRPTKERGAVFVRSAVLLAEGYLLSVEIWVVEYVCPKRSPCVCCDVVADKALSMKMLSEIEVHAYCPVV